MQAALLLIDLQRDYLRRADLQPPADAVISEAAALLSAFRAWKLPVVHARSLIGVDGSNRMPHWRRMNKWACVEGTAGAQPPRELAPRDHEPVFDKPFFSAFGCPDLAGFLREQSVDRLVVAGIYTHGCVRASVLDAYQAGFDVWVAADAVASYDPLHAELSRSHLHDRACQFLPVHEIVRRLDASTPARSRKRPPRADLLPIACVEGHWLPSQDQACTVRRNPSNWSEVLANVPIGRHEEVARATAAAVGHQPSWAQQPPAHRAALLDGWSRALQRRRAQMLALMVDEVGKSHTDAAAEFDYALALLAASTCCQHEPQLNPLATGVSFRRCPVGSVGIITPWNNPLALPVGKIAPALGWGNTVVWKPAMQAPRVSMLLMESLLDAGLPSGCVNMVFGEAETARAMLSEPRLAAISFTGSSVAGRQVAMACAAHGKALQAEMGGNNAAVVMGDCDIHKTAGELATAAFTFAGQRCTAVRRIIVSREIQPQFAAAFVEAAEALAVGLPGEPGTRIGPLVSRGAQSRVAGLVAGAVAEGGEAVCGGRVPPGYDHGCWYEPTVVRHLSQRSDLVQQETFGPVVVLSEAGDIADALRQLNDVEQGLVATLYCHEEAVQRRFMQAAEAGILRINGGAAAIHPDAPFGGWKASGLGSPEHGQWDRAFYTRPQAVYGEGPP